MRAAVVKEFNKNLRAHIKRRMEHRHGIQGAIKELFHNNTEG